VVLSQRQLTAKAAGRLGALVHNGHALGVDSAQVGVLEQADGTGIGGILKGELRGAAKAKVRLEVLRNLAHEARERQLVDQKLGRLLKHADVRQRHHARPLATPLLHIPDLRRRLVRGLGAQDACSASFHLWTCERSAL
jgi:hypothetical protein